jgi:HSP20 family molecular chaperone IbpA
MARLDLYGEEMRDIDEIDKLFKMMEDMMDHSFYGGYSQNRGSNKKDIEIFEDDKHLYITIELRGVDEKNLVVTPSENSIVLEIMYDNSWIKREYTLPSKINPKKSKIKFNNCILDMELLKVKEKKNEKQNNGQPDRVVKGNGIQKS